VKRRRASFQTNPSNSNDAHPARVPVRFRPGLERRIASYAMAAGATGVSVLALAQPVKADIVYTPANIDISYEYFFQPYYFPINFNGQAQLTFTAFADVGAGCEGGTLCEFGYMVGVRPAPGNALALGPLARGYQIGPHANFGGSGWINSFARGFYWQSTGHQGFSFSFGPWASKSGYLGVRFLIDGGTHYGWVALSVFEGTGEVTGYAYDTVANQPINAGQTSATPEPGTLGVLALGSLGLGYWRKRKQAGR